MTKLDAKRQFKALYGPSAKEPALVHVPPFDFLMIDGAGAPADAEFPAALGALYSAAYTLKFMLKKRSGGEAPDYTVMPLEALWWVEGLEDPGVWVAGDAVFADHADAIRWRAMIMQPGHLPAETVAEAVEEAHRKRAPAALDRLRFERWEEGLSAQIMHVGPYAAEAPTIQRLHAFAREQGHELRGRHHEIYLGDPRRTSPERLRTVLRHPVEPRRSDR